MAYQSTDGDFDHNQEKLDYDEIKQKQEDKSIQDYYDKLEYDQLKLLDQGIIKEKSSLENFANKYVIEGEHGFTPMEFFKNNAKKLKDFLRNNKNIKLRMVLVSLMEKQQMDKEGISGIVEDKAYFNSETNINLESTDEKRILASDIRRITNDIDKYQQNGSGWYFKEIKSLEIHTAEYKPMNGSSYIPLPAWISKKRAIVNIQNRDEKCFLWCVLRYIHPREDNDIRLTDLKKYEHSLNTKGINFPMKIKDISKFEKLNPELPGINVFSVSDNNKFYPLRMAEKDCQNTIDLFLHAEDGKSHYSFIKNFNRLLRTE